MVFTRDELKGGEARYRYATRVRFQDVDLAGVVFFARYFEFVHDAWGELLRERGLAIEELLREGTFVLPLKHVEADYLRPLRAGDPIEVQLVATRPGERELSLGWRIVTSGGATVHAVVTTVHAAVDVRAFKAIPLPERLRTALADLLPAS